MDKRGIPIVLCSSNYIHRRPHNHNSIPHGLSSPYIFQTIPSEVSLLEAYDSFADACFQSHFKYIEKSKKKTIYDIDKLYKQSMVSLEKVTAALKTEKPENKKRQFKPEEDKPPTSHPETLKRHKLEIDAIYKSFPALSRYYRLIGRAGRGTFSKVYKARDLFYDKYKPFKRCYEINDLDEHYVAIKTIYDISSPQRIANEITFLSKLRSSSCIIPLITAFRNKSTTYLVFPYIEYDNFDDTYTKMSLVDMKYYLLSLFTALSNTHAKGIIHRDVKPGNFLFSLKDRKGFLTDFGLAEKASNYEGHNGTLGGDTQRMADQYREKQKEKAGVFKNDGRKSVHVNRSGTKGFRAPEVMMRYEYQTTAIDIWAVGIILLSFLSGCYPFFNADDDADIMLELAHIYGLKNLLECGEHYGTD